MARAVTAERQAVPHGAGPGLQAHQGEVDAVDAPPRREDRRRQGLREKLDLPAIDADVRIDGLGARGHGRSRLHGREGRRDQLTL